jgi:hypothetical protein
MHSLSGSSQGLQSGALGRAFPFHSFDLPIIQKGKNMRINLTKKQSQAGKSGIFILLLVAAFFAWCRYDIVQHKREAELQRQEADRQIWGFVGDVAKDVIQSRGQEPITTELQPRDSSQTYTPQPWGFSAPNQEQPSSSTTRIYDDSYQKVGEVRLDENGNGTATIYNPNTSNPNDEMQGASVTIETIPDKHE